MKATLARLSSLLRFRKQPEVLASAQPVSAGSANTLEAALAAAAVTASDRTAPTRSAIALQLLELRAKGLLAPEELDHKIANEFRAIKRTLLSHLPGRSETALPGANTILVASSLPGEGKTTCALNLALALALERDYQVVLVDADVVNPSLSRTLGIDRQVGLLDVLRDPVLNLSDVEVATGIAGLTVISCGTRGSDAPELLSSARMASIARRMAEAGKRLFVFDTTPLLLTNESRALSEMVGQVAFVVRAGKTARSAVKAAIRLLPKDTYVGLLLNARASGLDDDYYDQYGGYYDRVEADTPDAAA